MKHRTLKIHPLAKKSMLNKVAKVIQEQMKKKTTKKAVTKKKSSATNKKDLKTKSLSKYMDERHGKRGTKKREKLETELDVLRNKKPVVKKATNKELDAMLAVIKKAKKDGAKSVVVFTTNREHHKDALGSGGFGVNDLKPKYLAAYKHLLTNYIVDTKLVSMTNCSVEWIVKLK